MKNRKLNKVNVRGLRLPTRVDGDDVGVNDDDDDNDNDDDDDVDTIPSSGKCPVQCLRRSSHICCSYRS